MRIIIAGIALEAGIGVAWVIAFGDQIPAMICDEVRWWMRRRS